MNTYALLCFCSHDDVIKWKHFPRYWPFVRGIHWSPVNSPHKALMFSLICAWINGWVNSGEAGDLRRHCTHYDVTAILGIDQFCPYTLWLPQWPWDNHMFFTYSTPAFSKLLSYVDNYTFRGNFTCNNHIDGLEQDCSISIANAQKMILSAWWNSIETDELQSQRTLVAHDDVTKWKHFPRYWPFVRGIHRSPVNSPHSGQWRGALVVSLICAWINGWVNSGDAGDLRRHCAHYNVTVMLGIDRCYPYTLWVPHWPWNNHNTFFTFPHWIYQNCSRM